MVLWLGSRSGCSMEMRSASSRSGRASPSSQKSFAPCGVVRLLKLYILFSLNALKSVCLLSMSSSSCSELALLPTHTSAFAKCAITSSMVRGRLPDC